MIQAGFRKGKGTRVQIANIHWIVKKKKTKQNNKKKHKWIPKEIYFCFIDYAKDFVSITKNLKILQEMGIPDQLTCLLRNLYAGQEAAVSTGHGTMDWFQIGKGICQGCILSPCLFNICRVRACMLSRFSCVQLCVTLWTVARQAPLSMGFSRQEYWSGLPLYHVKCQAGWITSWNQDFQEKYQ